MDPFARYLPALEATLQAVVARPPAGPTLLYGMLRYHLGWADADFQPVQVETGKRLRPIFLLLACEAQGGAWQPALPAAAAVELLHNFSLIHDDIEDRDTSRRGRPTLWTLWGEAQAINAGDALFALGYQALFGLWEAGVPPERIRSVQTRYNETVLRLTEGQCRDIAFESQSTVDEAAYVQMIEGKTAALLGLSCELGGLIAGAPAGQTTALREFGEALGLAFQMEDDHLGLWGDPARTGKAAGADLLRRKKTLPILHGLAHSAEFRALLARPTLDEHDVATGLALLEATGSRTHTLERAATYHAQALTALTRAGGSGEAQTALVALARQLLNRDK